MIILFRGQKLPQECSRENMTRHDHGTVQCTYMSCTYCTTASVGLERAASSKNPAQKDQGVRGTSVGDAVRMRLHQLGAGRPDHEPHCQAGRGQKMYIRKYVVAIRAPAASPTAAEPPVYQSRANTPNSPGSTLSHSGRPVPRSRRIALALPAPVAERLGEPSAPHPSRLLSFRSHLPRPYRLIPLPSLGKPAVRRARLEARAGGTTAP